MGGCGAARRRTGTALLGALLGVTALGVTALGVTGCGATASTSGSDVAGSANGNGVSVTLRWQPAPTTGGDGTLVATFTPQQAGFHLYGTQLPATGVDGVGRPTRITVGGDLAATGPAVAGQPTRPLRVPGTAQPVPVFPDGPVTLRLPVHRGGTGAAWARLSYAACSATSCQPPVAGLRVPLTLPG